MTGMYVKSAGAGDKNVNAAAFSRCSAAWPSFDRQTTGPRNWVFISSESLLSGMNMPLSLRSGMKSPF
jgi:hypothetical protein